MPTLTSFPLGTSAGACSGLCCWATTSRWWSSSRWGRSSSRSSSSFRRNPGVARGVAAGTERLPRIQPHERPVLVRWGGTALGAGATAAAGLCMLAWFSGKPIATLAAPGHTLWRAVGTAARFLSTCTASSCPANWVAWRLPRHPHPLSPALCCAACRRALLHSRQRPPPAAPPLWGRARCAGRPVRRLSPAALAALSLLSGPPGTSLLGQPLLPAVHGGGRGPGGAAAAAAVHPRRAAAGAWGRLRGAARHRPLAILRVLRCGTAALLRASLVLLAHTMELLCNAIAARQRRLRSTNNTSAAAAPLQVRFLTGAKGAAV